MGSYVPNSKSVQQEMLHDIGVPSIRSLYTNVPDQMFLNGNLNLPHE